MPNHLTDSPTDISNDACRFIPESPRWLYATNKPQKAEKVVRKIAKFNKVDLQLPEELDVIVKVSLWLQGRTCLWRKI